MNRVSGTVMGVEIIFKKCQYPDYKNVPERAHKSTLGEYLK
jgi:hypothetical protein